MLSCRHQRAAGVILAQANEADEESNKGGTLRTHLYWKQKHIRQILWHGVVRVRPSE